MCGTFDVEQAVLRRPRVDCKAVQGLAKRRVEQNQFAKAVTTCCKTPTRESGQAAANLARQTIDGSQHDGQPTSWIQRKISVAAARRRISAMAVGGATVVTLLAATACGESQAVERSMPAPAATAAPVGAAAPAHVERSVEKIVTRAVAVEKIVRAPAAQAAPQASAPGRPVSPAPIRPSATIFQDYGRQPFVATAEDAVSTFSLDTDRTSYQLALSWLRQGYDVEPDSVRAEEWINAFSYQYPAPADDWGFAIASNVAASPVGCDQAPGARIGFQAAEVADERPLNVTLVLDASGSMR